MLSKVISLLEWCSGTLSIRTPCGTPLDDDTPLKNKIVLEAVILPKGGTEWEVFNPSQSLDSCIHVLTVVKERELMRIYVDTLERLTWEDACLRNETEGYDSVLDTHFASVSVVFAALCEVAAKNPVASEVR